MNTKTIVYILIAVLVFVGIVMLIRRTGSEGRDFGRVRSAEEVTLQEGQAKDAAGLGIKLNRFVQDNRCGADENCPEAGGVTVNVTLTAPDGTTATGNIASDDRPLQYAGYDVSIVGVMPARTASTTIEDKDYQVTLRAAPAAGSDDNVQNNPGI